MAAPPGQQLPAAPDDFRVRNFVGPPVIQDAGDPVPPSPRIDLGPPLPFAGSAAGAVAAAAAAADVKPGPPQVPPLPLPPPPPKPQAVPLRATPRPEFDGPGAPREIRGPPAGVGGPPQRPLAAPPAAPGLMPGPPLALAASPRYTGLSFSDGGDGLGVAAAAPAAAAPAAPPTTAGRRIVVLFAHGMRFGKRSPWMRAWAERLRFEGVEDVVTFDYDYITHEPAAPVPPVEVLLAEHANALADVRARFPGRRVVLAGKSLGAYVSALLAAKVGGGDDGAVVGVAALGFPLLPLRGPPRDAALRALRVPALLVAGSADELCPLERLAAATAGSSPAVQVVEVRGGDHSLLLADDVQLAAGGVTQADSDAAVGEAWRRWVSSL